MKPICGGHDRLRFESSRQRGLEPIIALFRPRLRLANPDLEPSELLSYESDGGKAWLHLPARGAGRQAETLRTAAPRSGGAVNSESLNDRLPGVIVKAPA